MSGAAPGGTGQESSQYAFEGYPIEELRHRYSRGTYRLQEYEEQAIRDIKACLEKRKFRQNSEMCEENILFLQSLVKKLTLVLASEQHEGIMNNELRMKIEEIKALYSKLMAELDTQEIKG